MAKVGVYGTMCSFETPADLLHAAQATRDAGYSRFETYTPFPVHHIDKAMGLKETRVPWFALGGGLTGATAGTFLQAFANGIELKFDADTLFYVTGYKFIVSGKPPFDIIPSIPIIFELTVLLSVFGALAGVLILSRLPMWYHPTFKHKTFKQVTDDRFFLAIEATDSKYVDTQVRDFLLSLGGEDVEEIAL